MDTEDGTPISAASMRLMAVAMAGMSAGAGILAGLIVWRASGWNRAWAAVPATYCATYALLSMAGLKEASRQTVEDVLES